MIYRKFRADALFTGMGFADKDSVLITDSSGVVLAIESREAHPDAAYYPGTICPGFINTHCHLELSWMHGLIPERSGMIDFLLAVMKTPKVAAEDILRAAKAAEQEMLQHGIIAVGDICNTTATHSLKNEGNLYYHNFIEAMGIDPNIAARRMKAAADLFNAFATGNAMPLSSNSIVPHAPYSVSDSLLKMITGFPGNHLVSVHNQEHTTENELFLQGTGDFHRLYKAIGFKSDDMVARGFSGVQHLLAFLYKNQSIIFVHNVETGEADLAEIRAAVSNGIRCSLCLCPNANLYINGKLPDIRMLENSGINITMGTDSLASNNQLDILEELKTIYNAGLGIGIDVLLRWATLNGALALEIDDETGSFSPGKQPGIVWLKQVNEKEIGNDAVALRLL
ncbi:MAG: amidohydrolase [Chitinophagaceae bacterium]|nr:MAG: amidohydrolase [Chitinophagaceae bacterium]